MMAVLKNVGKGILYIIGLPFFLIVLVGTALMGIFLLVFMFFKSIILFFTGRSLDDDLPEDIKVKEIKYGKSSPAPSPVVNAQEEPVIQPYVAPQNNTTIEEAVFGHPTYEAPIVEEPVEEEEEIEEEEQPLVTSSIEINDEPIQKPSEINNSQYVPHTSGSRFIDEEEEEEDSGVTITYGDDDD